MIRHLGACRSPSFIKGGRRRSGSLTTTMINPLPNEFGLQAQIAAGLAFCIGLIAIIHHTLAHRSRPPLPPGPPGNPIFGNSLPKALYVVLSGSFPQRSASFTSAYRHFEKWTQEYGPVFSIRQGLTTIVVIGRLQAAMEILEKEGAATADRPRSIAAGETLSGGMRLVLTLLGRDSRKCGGALYPI
jgi:hypothetical protein